jgi:hypothetical protein
MISFILAAIGVPQLMAGLLAPVVLDPTYRKQAAGQGGAAGGGWWARYQTRLIICMAFLEGTAFMQLMAYLVEGQLFSLLFALLCLFVMVTFFPTRDGVETWMAEQERLSKMPA